MSNKHELRIYVLINSSLKMSNGKIISQICHGITDIIDNLNLPCNNVIYKNYKSMGQPKIILKCQEVLLKQIYEKYCDKSKKVWCIPIFDAGKTQVPSESFTCLVFFPMIRNDVPEEFDSLKLY